MRSEVVGLDPASGRRLVHVLLEADAALDAASRRVQALLDEAGQACGAPAMIRGVARTCGAAAADLERRVGLVSGPGSATRPWMPAGGLPRTCGPPPGVVNPPITASTSAIVVLGRTILVTPPAPRGPQVVYTTVGGQPCGTTVYTTTRRPGVGKPVPPPRILPAFPDAVGVPRKMPRQGGGTLRKRWKGADGRIYEWDSQHGTVEVYNKKGTRHLGEYDPGTGRQVKPPNPTRTVTR